MAPSNPHPWPARLQAILLVLLMALPYIQRVNRPFKESLLAGAEIAPARPILSWANWFNASFAPASEKYMTYKIGFRGHGIKLRNQVNTTLFRRATGTFGTPVTLGRDGWIYETEYVNRYVDRTGMEAERRARFAADLAALQDELERCGIVFALVITPSKAEIIPEHLPGRLVARRRTTPNAYEQLLPELAQAGVRVMDAHAWFAAEHARGAADLFPRGGTHWSYDAAFRFCRHMLAQLQPLMPQRLRVPALAAGARRPAQGTDRDLALLLNVFVCPAREDLLPYPDFAGDALPMAQRPGILLVGDSFAFTIVDALNRARAGAETDLLYYFKRVYNYPAADIPTYLVSHQDYVGPPLEDGAVDWERYLLSKELVLLEINEIMLPEESWGFVPAALAFLRAATP